MFCIDNDEERFFLLGNFGIKCEVYLLQEHQLIYTAGFCFEHDISKIISASAFCDKCIHFTSHVGGYFYGPGIHHHDRTVLQDACEYMNLKKRNHKNKGIYFSNCFSGIPKRDGGQSPIFLKYDPQDLPKNLRNFSRRAFPCISRILEGVV